MHRGVDITAADSQPLPSVIAEVAAIFGVFFLQGAWPVPDVNETVYLAQMKHAWDPNWAAGDIYLQSADAHGVVTWLLGWLSLVLPMPAFAWAGRLITWWLLAWSWRRLSFSLAPKPGWAIVSAALFVCLQERCQMAGEWVIGGFEAKGFAYVLVFIALEMLVRNRWNSMLLLLGAASACHVLVGGWSAIAACVSWLVMRKARPPLASLSLGLVGGLLLSLPGLWPALRMNAAATTEQVRQADAIYVLERLSHHLAPQQFAAPLVLKMLLLWVVFLLLWRLGSRDEAWRRLSGFVLGAVGIAVFGWLLSVITASNAELYSALMRYYWFRLIDAVLPLGVALGAVHWIAALARLNPAAARGWLGTAAGIGLLHLAGYVVERPFPVRPRADRQDKVSDYTAWRHVCDWARKNTPPNALFLTPRTPQTFRWHSGRGEVVNWKDLPQDTNTMLEWRDRMQAVHGPPSGSNPSPKWLKSLTMRTPVELRTLGQRFGADYLVTDSFPPLALPCLYRNDSYAVYGL